MKTKKKPKVKKVLRLFLGGVNHGTQILLPQDQETVCTSRIEKGVTVKHVYNLKAFVYKDLKCLAMTHEKLSDETAARIMNSMLLNLSSVNL